LRDYLKSVLDVYLRDDVNARELRADGSYERVPPTRGGERSDSQMYFEGGTIAEV